MFGEKAIIQKILIMREQYPLMSPRISEYGLIVAPIEADFPDIDCVQVIILKKLDSPGTEAFIN